MAFKFKEKNYNALKVAKNSKFINEFIFYLIRTKIVTATCENKYCSFEKHKVALKFQFTNSDALEFFFFSFGNA